MKIRVRDLKQNDVFRVLNTTYRVHQVTDTHFRCILNGGTYKVVSELGIHSMEWVTFIENYINKRKVKPVTQYSLNGEEIESFDCVADAVKKTGAHKNGILKCLRGESAKSFGFIWKPRNDKKALP